MTRSRPPFRRHVARRTTGAGVALVAALAAALVALPPSPQPSLALADDPESFTLVVVPDTQKYALDPNLHQVIGAQTEWIVDSQDELNTKFVVQVGDLVESWPNIPQWERVSGHFETLDAASVPYAVLPGNHDMNINTGESPPFETYFGPHRFEESDWSAAGAEYGGYLGDNQFGPDPIDRYNMDNYALLSAGGLDFLFLQLEFESPEYSLEWAQKVIDAHPDRRVIVSTHGFINTAGTRSNHLIRTDVQGKTANDVWNELIYPNCNIFLVLNGHWSDGDIGEARRSDANACGSPVHQVLTDYQGRSNGGNGWLRYYTFSPAANSIQAHTYSPTLDAFELDADSSFSMAYDMTDQGGTAEALVMGGSDWRYRYAPGAWPSGWESATFDDSSWDLGQAPLGFGTPPRTTVVDVPPPTSARPLAMLFRREVTVVNPQDLSELRLVTHADDGLVVRINGEEIGRRNLPAGQVGPNTYASAAPRTTSALADPVVFDIPAGTLVEGNNVIAVSTHLNYRGTPDISFDLILSGVRTTGGSEPAAPAAPTATAEVVDDAVELAWTPGDLSALSGFQVTRDGNLLSEVGPEVRGYTDTDVVAGHTYEYGIVAVGANGLSSAATTVEVQVPSTEEPAQPLDVVLVEAGAQWQWLFESAAWPAGWTQRDFDDDSWTTGTAPFGWGHPSIATNIDVPPPTSNRPRTALFRHEVTLENVAELSSLEVSTRADDGVAIWINGTEIGRAGLPAGTLSTATYALAAPRTNQALAAPVTFDIPASTLVEGNNVITVSNHHNYRGTPDINFDLSITATRTRP